MLSRLRLFRRPVQRLFSQNLKDESIDHQQYNRHQNKVALHDFHPRSYDSQNISPSAVLVGEVNVMEDSTVGEFSVLKGDLNMIKIDYSSTVMENCYLSTVSELDKTGQKAWLYICHESLVLPGASIISAEIERGVTIGARSIICEGVKIGENTVIGANSVVPPYRYIPAHQLWAGNPVRFVKDLSKQEMASVRLFKQALRKMKRRENIQNLSNESAFLYKEVLDDLEIDLKREDLSLKDLEQTLKTMESCGNDIFFARELIQAAKARVARGENPDYEMA